jgi:hypothetical protein
MIEALRTYFYRRDEHLIPQSDLTFNLGSTGRKWDQIYAGTVNYTDAVVSNTLYVEGYAAFGDGAALSSNVTVIINRDFTSSNVNPPRQLFVGGNITKDTEDTQVRWVDVNPEGTTIDNVTSGLVASVYIDEPVITLANGGTVTDAATVYIVKAPTEAGTGNYALWVDAGLTRLDGNVFINEIANTFMTTGLTINQGGADDEALCLKSSDINHPVTAETEADTYARFQKHVASTGGLNIKGYSEARAAGNVVLVALDGGDLTITGTVTSLREIQLVPCSVTAATAQTCTDAATLYIGGAPSAAGSATITNPWSIWVDGSACRFDGDVRIGAGLYVGGTGVNPVTGWVYGTGGFYANETANTFQTIGMTLNQGANSDEILTLKSSSVGHGITDDTEADTFGAFAKVESTSGGMGIIGYKDADGVAGAALAPIGRLGEAADTTKSAAGYGVIHAIAQVISGASIGSVGADGNLFSIVNNTSTKFLFDAEGEMHSDAIIGVGDDWHDWDDLAMAADLSVVPTGKWNEVIRYNAEDFERAGLLTLSIDEDGNRHAFIKHQTMLFFYANVFRDIYGRLKKYEQALSDLGVDPVQIGA